MKNIWNVNNRELILKVHIRGKKTILKIYSHLLRVKNIQNMSLTLDKNFDIKY